MPGPVLCISMYVGTVTDGVLGGIACWVAMFLPAFLTIWGALPYWNTNSPWVNKFLKGFATTAVGFIFTATAMITKSVAKSNIIACLCVACASYGILYTKKVSVPIIVFLGGIVYLLINLVTPINI